MGLENLRSVFSQNISKFKNTDVTELGGAHIDMPILDNMIRQADSFVSQDLLTKYYDSEYFDPRSGFAKPGTKYYNINTYTGTTFIATNPTDFSTAGIGYSVYNPVQVPFTPAPATNFDVGIPLYESLGLNMVFPISAGPYGNFQLSPGSVPTLDKLWPEKRQPPTIPPYDSDFFIDDLDAGIGTHPYQFEVFDPRTPKNTGITITKKAYKGTKQIPTDPTDFSTAGIGETNYIPLQVPFTPAPATNFDIPITADNPLQNEYYTTPTQYEGLNSIVPSESPLLDKFWPDTNQPPHTEPYDSDFFVDDINAGVGTHPFRVKQFDPRTPKNTGITITKNTYAGTAYKALDLNDPETFQTAGSTDDLYTHTNFLGKDLETSDGWSSLYNKDHTPRLNFTTENNSPFQPYTGYGPNVNRERLSIRWDSGRDIGGNLGFSRVSAFHRIAQSMGEMHPDFQSNMVLDSPSWKEGREPYIVSNIPRSEDDASIYSGRWRNKGSREIPVFRAMTDFERQAKMLASEEGVAFIVKQNAYGIIPTPVVRDKNPDPNKSDRKDDILRRVPQRYNRFMNPLGLSVHLASAARLLGHDVPNQLWRKDAIWFGASSDYTFQSDYNIVPGGRQVDFQIDHTFTSGMGNLDGETGFEFLSWIDEAISGEPVEKVSKGDRMTLAKMLSGDELDTVSADDTNTTVKTTTIDLSGATPKTTTDMKNLGFDIDSEKNGMPLYFKDLRDNTYIFFRAYIEGLNETFMPIWSPIMYIGRSEPVYVYGQGDRMLSFTLKIFAHTQKELSRLYEKLNRLSSLAYPEYKKDEIISISSPKTTNTRMKPPLCKFRLGELYGKTNEEQLGFIESLNYMVPESSTWETDPKIGRVPKHIIANIGFRCIHEPVPELGTKFYGYIGD